MPPQAISFRPQTSRQAKKAYQKARASPRLSEADLRRVKRSEELEERAARIRAHNTRARENKRKKAEKLQRERETRKRMGVPEPAKIKISSSQLNLGAFVVAGIVKEEEEQKCFPPDAHRAEVNESGVPQPKLGESKIIAERLDQPGSTIPHPYGSSVAPVSKDVPSCLATTYPQNLAKEAFTTGSLMLPPPPRLTLHKTPCNPTERSISKPSNNKLDSSRDSDWDSIFDSNTQVEREISDNLEKPIAPILQPPLTSINTPSKLPYDLFANISTQDLRSSPSSPSTVKGNLDRDFNCESLREDLSPTPSSNHLHPHNEPMDSAQSLRTPKQQQGVTAATGIARAEPKTWAAAAAVLNPTASCPIIHLPGSGPVSDCATTAVSKSFDEFDAFGISSQDLRELDV
ncbi:MAG: hypothetical protein Q9170_004423 [Blastenia crenularia]